MVLVDDGGVLTTYQHSGCMHLCTYGGEKVRNLGLQSTRRFSSATQLHMPSTLPFPTHCIACAAALYPLIMIFARIGNDIERDAGAACGTCYALRALSP